MKQLPRKSFFYATLALALAFTQPSHGQAIPSGTTATTDTITTGGTYTLASGQTLDYTGGSQVINATTSDNATTFDIEGTLINATSGAKAGIAVNNASNTKTPYEYTIDVGTGGDIETTNADAILFKVGGSSNGALVLNVNNLGTIHVNEQDDEPGSGFSEEQGYAIDTHTKTTGVITNPTAANYFTAGGTITNGAGTFDAATNTATTTNGSALIQDDSEVAIQMGQNQTLNNWGTILNDSTINDSSKNNAIVMMDDAQLADVGRGVEMGNFGDTVNNYGTIEGAQHGLDESGAATNLVVNNYGTIIGDNGSGIGADTVAANPNNEIVTNHGNIYAKNASDNGKQIIDQSGNVSPDSDPDGIDIDGGATIYNYGLVQAVNKAGGYDTNGRANGADGVTIGGGNVFNYKGGQIISAQNAVTVNNDSEQGRSGDTALHLENDGTINGQDGYAIRSENRANSDNPNGIDTDTGLSNENDTVVNTGTIIGGTAAPDPSQVITIEGGTQDELAGGSTNSDTGVTTVDVLDGVSYVAGTNGFIPGTSNEITATLPTYTDATGTHTGNARFVDGDGSAIQLGNGNDTITNTGTITGLAGKAINMEDGDDTVNIEQGSQITGDIDGGNGSEVVGDTLNLDTDDTLGLHELSTDGTADGTAITADSSKSDTFTFASAILNFEHVNALSGKTILTGNSTYNGETIVGGGSAHARLEQDGTHTETNGATGALDYHVENNGTLAGSGTVTLATAATPVTVDQGGAFAPGSTTGPGKFTLAQGSVLMNGEMDFRLNGDTAGTGYDQFSLLDGTFTLGATSTLNLTLGYDPTVGDSFTLVDNEGAAAIAGTFAGLAQGADFVTGGQEFSISYTGGDSNDVVLTDLGAVPEPSTYALMLGSAGFLILLARRKLNAQV